ncbi:hypothetical protein VN97_g296 [Penicillium thymicola]|uniref:Uncharacterized protein n=1 Tax=Penicillium thymicola TaxID=293382 RepID=A0AAI9TT30_PENTH|nr:hypothetical protein VN97_g296 [Penicillium thymicola]
MEVLCPRRIHCDTLKLGAVEVMEDLVQCDPMKQAIDNPKPLQFQCNYRKQHFLGITVLRSFFGIKVVLSGSRQVGLSQNKVWLLCVFQRWNVSPRFYVHPDFRIKALDLTTRCILLHILDN